MFMQTIAAAAAAGVVLSAAAAGASDWSYEGADGPAHWGSLSPDYAACAEGGQQSPVDLAAPLEAELGEVKLHWNAGATWTAVNNGHAIQADAADAGHAMIDGKRYDLKQFHFHSPSEHAIDGERFAMEAHFVHAAEDGALAVIGVMMTGGGGETLFDAVMAAAPREVAEAPLGAADPAALLPEDRAFLRYQGSLTTPPCSETVLWTVLQTPLQVSDAAVAAFRALHDGNARPLQDLNRRFVLAED